MANGQINKKIMSLPLLRNIPLMEHFYITTGIHSGGGYLFASKQHGWNISGDGYFMFSDNFGLGAKYSLFSSAVQKDFTVENYLLPRSMIPQYVHADTKEIQYIHYAGPSGIYQHWLDKNNRFLLSGTLSAGYVHYRKETRTEPNQNLFNNILSTGSTWGANIGVSAEYFPIKRRGLAIGVSTNYKYARLTKINEQTRDVPRKVNFNAQSLARLDYLITIRSHFQIPKNKRKYGRV